MADRPDVLGAFWYVCLVAVPAASGRRSRSTSGAFVAVSCLELVGTHLGTWAWGTHDPTGLVSIGNPPSGAAGGYGWFDLAGLLAAPVPAGGSAPVVGVGPRRRILRPAAADVR